MLYLPSKWGFKVGVRKYLITLMHKTQLVISHFKIFVHVKLSKIMVLLRGLYVNNTHKLACQNETVC